jgi:Flp pilus assembly protein TadG
MAKNRVLEFLRDQGGVAAVELAILGPVYLVLLLGVIQGGLLVFTKANLHYAVQKGVRCTALQDSCPSPASYYASPGAAPVFTSAQEPCGQVLTATVTYTLSLVLYQRDIALSATSCFPNIKGVRT